MEGFSLKSRAIAFAMCAGAVAFILALAAIVVVGFGLAVPVIVGLLFIH